MLVSSSFILAQWVPTNGPNGGSISSIAVSGDNILAGTRGGGIYLSSNNGINWNQVNDGLTDWDVNSIAANGNIVFAVTGGGAWAPGGVYRSTNYGRSWALVFFPPINPGVISIAIKGNYIYAGTIDGLYRSTDTGLSWSQVYPAGFYRAYALAVNGNNIFAGTYYGIFRSTDDGTSWLPINNGLPTNPFVSSFAISGNTIFAGDYSKGIYLSNDNGLNWSRVNNGLTDTSVYSLAISGNNIFAGTVSGGIFLSTNNGSHWDMVNTGLSVNQCVNSLTTKGNNILAGMSGAGVYLSTNNGTIWTPANDGITNSSITTFATNAGNIFAGTNLLGVFLSTNNGISWTSVNDGLSSNISVTKLAVNDNKLFAGTSSGIFNSTNNGTNWNLLNSGLQGVNSFTFSGNYIIVGKSQGGAGIYVSSDNGLNWNQTFNYSVYALARSPNTTGGYNIFAASSQGVLLSTDNGLNWNIVLNPLSNYGFYSIVTNGNIIYAGSGGAQLIFRSSDNGQSWLSVTNGLPMLNGIIEFAMYGNNLFALASRTSGMATNVFLSINDGISWISINNDTLPEYWAMNFPTIAISESNLFIGTTGSGVFRRPLSEMIPTNSIVYPKITLSAGSINTGQSIIISGHDFHLGGTANINIYSNSGFSQNVNNISINAQGTFNYNFVTTTGMPIGLYSIHAIDNFTGLSAQNSSFALNSSSVQTNYLNIISPSQTFTVNAGESFMVEWKDKMITGSNYPITGSQRNYKYTIELSDNNGLNWVVLGSISGTESIENWVMLHYYPTISTPGINYKIRITDFYNTANSQNTSPFTVSSATYTGNLKVSLDWDHSYEPPPSVPVAGIAADGVARIYLNLSKINNSIGPNISSVSVVLSDLLNGNSPSKLGRVKKALQTTSYSLEANGIQSITDVDNTPNKNNYNFWYVAPDDFCGADPNDLKNSYRFVNATFTVNYDNSLNEVFIKKILIVRPPLALVHGLASSPSAWNNFTFTSPNGLKVQFLSSYNYLFKQVNAIRILPDGHFYNNAFGIVVPSSSQPIMNTLQGVILKMRDKGYAANKVDYVGHSMGGNVIRQTINLFPNAYYVTGNFSSSPYKNYEMGFVHKIITLNTPHNGSPWGDLVSQTTPSLEWIVRHPLSDLYNLLSSKLSSFIHPIGSYNYLTLSYDEFEASDAVKDLEVNDPGINMAQTNIPSHLIAGDVFGNSSTIDPYVWNTTDQMPFFTRFINLYWQALRAKETDPVKKAQLNNFSSINSNAERAVRFIDYYVSNYLGTPNFILDGDFIVPLSSQLAGLSTSAENVSIYSGLYSNHLFITEDLEVGDRVLQLINSPVSASLFNNIPASIKKNYLKNYLIQSPVVIISGIDTNKIKITSPANLTSFSTDSVLVVNLHVKDTSGLKYVVLDFQGENYLTTSNSSFISFNVHVNGEFLETQQIVATAVYDMVDTTKFLSDTVNINIAINQQIQSFDASSKMCFLLKNQTTYTEYYATYPNFVTKVNNINSGLTVSINDPTIVSRDLHSLGFTGKNDGETFAVIEYKGLKDTIYFNVNGESITGILDDGQNSTNSGIPDRYELFQSYPNPFNPTTTIKYSIPRVSFVNIRIYDILGREVKTLVNEEKLPGMYSIQFNGGNFTSGVYFYRLQAGSFVETKKFILLK